MLDLFTAQTEGTHRTVVKGVIDAINIFDKDKYEYEKNLASNVQGIIANPLLSQKVIDVIAEAINEKSVVYSYRIAKSKRIELAEDILVALSVLKKDE